MPTTETKLRNPGGDRHEEFDRDINVRTLAYAGVGLAGLTVLSFVVAWFVFGGLVSFEERRDPEPSPMPEAAEAVRPVGPTLQATPERELEQLLALEDRMLEGYGVADGGAYARVPIERAMEMLLAQGLGTQEGEPTAVGAELGAGEEEESTAELAPDTEPTEAERDERPPTDTPDESEGPDGE